MSFFETQDVHFMYVKKSYPISLDQLVQNHQQANNKQKATLVDVFSLHRTQSVSVWKQQQNPAYKTGVTGKLSISNAVTIYM